MRRRGSGAAACRVVATSRRVRLFPSCFSLLAPHVLLWVALYYNSFSLLTRRFTGGNTHDIAVAGSLFECAEQLPRAQRDEVQRVHDKVQDYLEAKWKADEAAEAEKALLCTFSTSRSCCRRANSFLVLQLSTSTQSSPSLANVLHLSHAPTNSSSPSPTSTLSRPSQLSPPRRSSPSPPDWSKFPPSVEENLLSPATRSPGRRISMRSDWRASCESAGSFSSSWSKGTS